MAVRKRRRRFTDQGIERLRYDPALAPPSGRIEIEDEVCPGLLLRITPGGVKSFSVIYKVPGEGGTNRNGRLLAGKQHRITLGATPPLRLVDARKQARAIIEQATHGSDPRGPRRAHNLIRHSNTFEKVRERFVADIKPAVKAWKNVERVLQLHVEPTWRDIPLSDIRRADVHALLDRLVAAAKVGTAREVRKHLSRLFKWSLNRELIAVSPIEGLQRGDLDPNIDAGRALSNSELRHFWIAAAGLGYPFGPLFQLLALTGQRRGEWAGARRREINFSEAILEVPKERHKSGRDHVIPLSEPAQKLVAALPAWPTAEYDYLLSSRGGQVPVSGFSKAKSALDKAMLEAMLKADPNAILTPFRIHDLRVTCETRLAALGFSQDARDAVLGHAKAGLQRNYNKHEYLEEKREALKAYAAHILEVVGGPI